MNKCFVFSVSQSGRVVVSKRPRMDTEKFSVTIKGKRNFDILTNIRDSLEMSDMVSNYDREEFIQQRRKREYVLTLSIANAYKITRVLSIPLIRSYPNHHPVSFIPNLTAPYIPTHRFLSPHPCYLVRQPGVAYTTIAILSTNNIYYPRVLSISIPPLDYLYHYPVAIYINICVTVLLKAHHSSCIYITVSVAVI